MQMLEYLREEFFWPFPDVHDLSVSLLFHSLKQINFVLSHCSQKSTYKPVLDFFFSLFGQNDYSDEIK